MDIVGMARSAGLDVNSPELKEIFEQRNRRMCSVEFVL